MLSFPRLVGGQFAVSGLRLVLAIALAIASRNASADWGRHGMVAADHRLASQAGVEMLKRGGNAVDAAVATAFAVCVVNPASCGIGGGGFMVIHLAKPRRTITLDYREVAPAAASRDMFLRQGKAVPDLSRIGGLASGVPGEVAGLSLALKRFGTLSLSTVLQPAIRLARDGFAAEDHLVKEIQENHDALARDAVMSRNFLRPDGTPLATGDLVKQPELARTLQGIARSGPAAFYRGDVARQIAAAVRRAGGVLTTQDLARYRPTWRPPVSTRFAGYDVYSMPPPSSGGGVLIEVLGMLGHDDLPALGQNSPTASHLLAEAMKHAFADRAVFYGDPQFVNVPLRRLLSRANLQSLRRRISAVRTFPQADYGSEHRAAQLLNDHGTSHLSVMDSQGNAVACTTTINTAFGALYSAGDTGIIMNNQMDDFSAQPGVPNVFGLIGNDANAVAPGKRPLSSMTPTIVLHRGRPVLAVGGSGGPLIISGTLQVVLDTLVYGMGAEEAVNAARIHHQWAPPVLLVEPGISQPTREWLARNGHTVKEVRAMAAIQAVRFDGGLFEGASDPRKGGVAVGW